MNTFKQKKGGIANKMDVKEKTKEAEELEFLEIEENIDKKNQQIGKTKYKITIRILIFVIIVLLVMLYTLCYRVGKIGYNYLSIWDTNQIVPITVTAEDIEIETKTELNIFTNSKRNWQNIIEPMATGTFKFSVKNDTNDDAEYHIQFLDEMSNFVNMKYKLKMDNVYIVGNKDTYVGIEELDVKNIVSPKDSISIFVLEWYWESDDEKDTIVGTSSGDQYYGLALHIYTQAYKR